MDNYAEHPNHPTSNGLTSNKLSSKLGTALIVSAALLGAYFVWPTPYAHYFQDDVNLRENRLTGAVQVLTTSGWVSNAENPIQIESKDTATTNPRDMPLPADQLSKIQVQKTEVEGSDQTLVTVKLYNWSNKPITGKVTFDISLLKNGKVAHQHQYVQSIYLPAQETTYCQIDTGFEQKEFREFEANTTIKEYKESE